jgi:protein gp37
MSAIEWTDETWNPVAGCSIISPGCTNCYAMRMAARLEAMGMAKYSGLTRRSGNRFVWTGKVRVDQVALEIPMRWKAPRKIFVNSMSDLFHEDIPEGDIARVWRVMATTPQHIYQILTKRSERLASIAATLPILPNVWLGVSVEDAQNLGRIDDLRVTPAAIRFVSFEPLLGSVKGADLIDIDWAIVGGESGPRARPMEPIWVEEIKRSCRAHGAAFFFKQWGGVNKKQNGRTFRGRTWDEYPSMPGVASAE